MQKILSKGMEIRNSAKKVHLEWLDTPELLEQLMLALRNVAVWEAYSSEESSNGEWIEMVQRVHRVLEGRGAEEDCHLQNLSRETGWLMESLLEECLLWPRVIPHVRELDGVRRFYRCWRCKQREFPMNSGESVCNFCLEELIVLLCQRTPPEGVVFFRTYNESRWCPHADAETVLMTGDDADFLANGRCEACLKAELQRRATSKLP